MLRLPIQNPKWKLYMKMEKFNPGQSMKDRMAFSMIAQAEMDGLLGEGGCIIESTSGNTGIGLAMMAAERGYRFIAIVNHHAAEHKIRMMKAYGAEIIYVRSDYPEDQVAVGEREALAEKLSREIPNSFFPRQADNPSNSEGYYSTLGPEIISDTEGEITALIGAVGTGGSLSGTARKLKEFNPNIRIIGVEPEGSIIFGGKGAPYYQSGTGNPANVDIAKNVDYSVIDQGLKVGDKEAFNTSRFLAKYKGILVGGSAGGVIYKALEFLRRRDDEGLMVAIVADGGERYLNTIFDDEWMTTRSLIDTATEEQLQQWIQR